jgi:hypothetical protein
MAAEDAARWIVDEGKVAGEEALRALSHEGAQGRARQEAVDLGFIGDGEGLGQVHGGKLSLSGGWLNQVPPLRLDERSSRLDR